MFEQTLQHIVDIRAAKAHLVDFGAAIDVSFATNLAYSLLIKYGVFFEWSMGRLADSEKLRVIPALAENDQFEEAAFSSRVDSAEKVADGAIKVLRVIAFFW